MRVLALDTTTREGSAALIDGDVVDERRGDAARSHAERLPTELTRLLDAHGLMMSAIDLFAVASGPGSFTGLRIGIATMQGLAFVTGRPIVAVSALDALPHAVADRGAPGQYVAVWMDAQRGEVFAALYRIDEARPFTPARLQIVGEPAVADPSTIRTRIDTVVRNMGRSIRNDVLFTGDGAQRYHELAGGARMIDTPLIAAAIGHLAIAAAAEGAATSPAAVRPLYIRRPDAEIDRERRAVAPTNTP